MISRCGQSSSTGTPPGPGLTRSPANLSVTSPVSVPNRLASARSSELRKWMARWVARSPTRYVWFALDSQTQ